MTNPLAGLLPEFAKFHQLGPQLALILGIVVFFGTWGGYIFQKLKVPQVVGFFVIGILIGDSGFQIIKPNVVAMLDPISIIALALIGFLVGGELKTDVIKKMGKQFVSVLLFESLVPAVIVGVLVTIISLFVTHNTTVSICYGLLLGAICSSTAPEATTNVLQEYRSRGPVTTMIYGLVAMDDAVALVLFAICSTICAPLLGGHATSLGKQLLNIVYTVFGSIGLGLLFGGILILVIRKLAQKEGLVLSFSLGLLLLCTGLCDVLGLNNILACMSTGFLVANFAPKSVSKIFDIVNKFTPPIYVLFFVSVGAKLDIWSMKPLLFIFAAVYLIGRTSGKALGSWFGAWITKAPKTVQSCVKYCLLSQAGVAIGLSLTCGTYFKDSIGNNILLVVTATTFILELIGPIFVKKGIVKAGEAGMNVTEEDIKNNSFVKDITWGTEQVCSCESNAIVNELDTVRDIVDRFTSHHYQTFVVRNSEGNLSGIITLEHIKETLLIGELAENLLATDVMDPIDTVCKPEMPLPELYQAFTDSDKNAIPILDNQDKVCGIAEKFAVDHYVHARILELHRQLESLSNN